MHSIFGIIDNISDFGYHVCAEHSVILCNHTLDPTTTRAGLTAKVYTNCCLSAGSRCVKYTVLSSMTGLRYGQVSGAESLDTSRDVSIYRDILYTDVLFPLVKLKNASFHVSVNLLLKSEVAANSDVTVTSIGDSIVASVAISSAFSSPVIYT